MMRRMARLWERHSEWRAIIDASKSGAKLLPSPRPIMSDVAPVRGYLERVEFREGQLKIAGWAVCQGRPLRSSRIVLANGTRSAYIEATVGVDRADVAASLDINEFVAPGFIVSSSEPIPLAGDIRLDLNFTDGTRASIDIGSYNLLRGGLRAGRRALQFLRFYTAEVVPRWPLFVSSKTRHLARSEITRKLDIDQFFTRQNVTIDSRVFVEPETLIQPLPEPVDIVIPTYNGFDHLPELFQRLAIHTTTRHRLIVVDDASPDPRVPEFLATLRPAAARCEDIVLIRNERNLGFVESVNRGFRESRRHVVILNTDIRVSANWLERLMQPIFDSDRVASTTPFTNRGTICSFPNLCRDNDMLLGLGVDEIDRHFRTLEPAPFRTELPTGIGFCMGLNRRYLDRVGFFDAESFGRGYGEENDWCCRAALAGGANVLVENLFVEHQHGASFSSAEKKALLDQNLKKLSAKHPKYFPRVSQFISADPAASLRALMVTRIAASNSKDPFEIIIDHDLGGGANKFRQDQINNHVKNHRPFGRIRTHGPSNPIEFIIYCGDQFQSFYFQDWAALHKMLPNNGGRKRKIVWVVNNLVGFHDMPKINAFLVERRRKSRDRVRVLIHDFLPICPSYNLLDRDGKYCGVPQLARCQRCLPENPFAAQESRGAEIGNWRRSWSNLLQVADQIVHFSETSRETLLRAFPDLKGRMVVRPHSVSWAVRRKLKVFPLRPEEPVRIGVVGSIGIPKGAAMVNRAAKIIARRELNAEIVVMGRLSRPVKNGHLRVLGPYKTQDLAQLIERERIHVFWVPSIWPETYSYVTTELMRLGVPIACFDLGAPRERLASYENGSIIPKMEAALAVRELIALAHRANAKVLGAAESKLRRAVVNGNGKAAAMIPANGHVNNGHAVNGSNGHANGKAKAATLITVNGRPTSNGYGPMTLNGKTPRSRPAKSKTQDTTQVVPRPV